MKIKCIGTGTLTTDRALTSFLIDDDILFDIGGGVVQELKKHKIDTSKIKNIIISHYHADHLFDLPAYIVRRNLRKENGDDLTIIGPSDIESVVSKIRDICSSGLEHLWDFPTINVKFAGLGNRESYNAEGSAIVAYDVVHAGTKPCSGYTIERNGITIGFSGDSAKCDGLDKIVEQSSAIFIDANSFEPDPMGFHLGLTGALEYATKYPNKKFYLIHRGDYELPGLPDNVFAPLDGEEVKL
ncbi:metal-dependent hydrolase [Alphaproteobacteria bacterium]|nr:metal-dependent hydrolase [Alphaproteobacteria bacterium]